MSLRDQGDQQAREVAANVTTDGRRVDGDVSVTMRGRSWAAKLWARVTAREAAKPGVEAGVDLQKRWFGGW